MGDGIEEIDFPGDSWCYQKSYVDVEGRSEEERLLAEKKLIERKNLWFVAHNESFLIDKFYSFRWLRFESMKCIFVHIPKNAGTSVEELLIGSASAPQSQHFTSRELEQHNPVLYQRLYRFCIVRNPYDRLLSAYEYLLSGGNKKVDGADVQWQKKLTSMGGFSAFVEKYFSKGEPDWATLILPSHFVPQYLFICNNAGMIDVDCCLSFEKFNVNGLASLTNQGYVEDVDLSHSCHCPTPPDSLTASPSAPHTRKGSSQRTAGYDVDGTLAELVYSAYKHDFEILGYAKDSWRHWVK